MSLTYKISSWTQIGECLSNTDRRLHAVCSKYLSDDLEGLSVRVEHEELGCLFSYLVQGDGPIISDISVPILSTDEIIDQFKRFGFYIIYEEEENISGEMIEYLMTLDKLGYDKIRILFIDVPPTMQGEDYEPEWIVVAFKVADHPHWINNTYRAKESEITEGTMNGTAINISAISKEKKFSWNFLKDYVLNIKDIIEENSRKD